MCPGFFLRLIALPRPACSVSSLGHFLEPNPCPSNRTNLIPICQMILKLQHLVRAQERPPSPFHEGATLFVRALFGPEMKEGALLRHYPGLSFEASSDCEWVGTHYKYRHVKTP